jgi:hypothetical protein
MMTLKRPPDPTLTQRERIERLIERLWAHDELTADGLSRDLDAEDADLANIEDVALTILEAYEEVRP